MSFDASFWVAIAFILFAALLIKLKVPSTVTRGLDNHADKVRQELETASKMRIEAEALAAQYSTKLADAEAEATELRNRTQREIAAMKSEAEAAVTDYIARRTKAAEARIAQAEQTALKDIQSRTASLAIQATENLVRAQVAAGKGSDIMNSSIKTVQTKLN